MFELKGLVKQNSFNFFKLSLIVRKLIFLASVIVLLVTIAPLPSLAQTKELEKEVAETTDIWLDTVTSGTKGVVEKVVALYAENGLLWGTVSEQARDTPAEIRDYFEYFAKLPKLSVNFYQGCVRVYNENIAVNSGYYTFTYEKNGETKEVPARFSFTYLKNDENKWKIMDHHSSALPKAPELLLAVNTDNNACENGLLVQR
jgi:hypothetical protein